MTLLEHVDGILDSNPFDLKAYLEEKLQEDSNFCKQYWNVKGRQMTILGYLISKYEYVDDSMDWSTLIDWLWKKHVLDKNIGAPIHQALAEQKINLARLLLKGLVHRGKQEADCADAQVETGVDYHARDSEGWTLLARVLETRDEVFIQEFFDQMTNVNVNDISKIDGRELSPIAQATSRNLPHAVGQLIENGAQLDQSYGLEEHSLIMLAAQAGSVVALDVLLASQTSWALEAVNHEDKTALSIVCGVLKQGKNKAEMTPYLQIAAMLICQGASIPQQEDNDKILIKYRSELLREMGHYLQHYPDLTHTVVTDIHDKNNGLHDVIYPKNPAFIVPLRFHHDRTISSVSRTVEGWLLAKHSSGNDMWLRDGANDNDLDAGENNTDSSLWFASFVEEYYKRIEQDRFFDPRSSMYRGLETGKITTEEQVRKHVRAHDENHRTAQAVKEVDLMFNKSSDSLSAATLGV